MKVVVEDCGEHECWYCALDDEAYVPNKCAWAGLHQHCHSCHAIMAGLNDAGR